jgi:recombination protein RecA
MASVMFSSPAQKSKQDIGEPSPWSLSETAGRIVEISGSFAPASLTFAFGLVLEAQRRGEPAGWITSEEAFFYPPDVSRTGVDLDALVVVRVRDSAAIPRAGEKLLRSGAFGLIVLDLGTADIPLPLQTRLGGEARRHHATLICLTEKERRDFSLGSLVSLRVHARRSPGPENSFHCALEALKDKRRGPTWKHAGIFHGPN